MGRFNIEREDGYRRLRFERTKKSQIRSNSFDSTRCFRVHPVLSRLPLCSTPQKRAPRRLQLSLRQIFSCILDLVVQQEFSPAAAEIEISHAVYQKHVVIAPGHASDRPAGKAQVFKKSTEEFFHIVSIQEANWLPLAPSGLGQFAKTRTKDARSFAETLPARFVQ